MEIMKLSGCVTLHESCQPAYLDSKVLTPLKEMAFDSNETAIAYCQKDNRLWIFGEGPVSLKEGNRVIKILRRLETVCDENFVLNTQRTFWELDICFANLCPEEMLQVGLA